MESRPTFPSETATLNSNTTKTLLLQLNIPAIHDPAIRIPANDLLPDGLASPLDEPELSRNPVYDLIQRITGKDVSFKTIFLDTTGDIQI